MVEIRIYVEGGGNSETTRAKLRSGFNTFLASLRTIANTHGIKKWQVVASGSRREAYDDFCAALKSHPDAFVVLLVDSEDPLPQTCSDPKKRNWEHLKKRQGDQWDCPVSIDDSQCFLMIQSMETWLVADRAALKKFYGQHFNDKALPANTNLESVAKVTIAEKLKQATSKTQKGEYHKTKHAFDILAVVDVAVVRKAVPSCDRLFTELESRIGVP